MAWPIAKRAHTPPPAPRRWWQDLSGTWKCCTCFRFATKVLGTEPPILHRTVTPDVLWPSVQGNGRAGWRKPSDDLGHIRHPQSVGQATDCPEKRAKKLTSVRFSAACGR